MAERSLAVVSPDRLSSAPFPAQLDEGRQSSFSLGLQGWLRLWGAASAVWVSEEEGREEGPELLPPLVRLVGAGSRPEGDQQVVAPLQEEDNSG